MSNGVYSMITEVGLNRVNTAINDHGSLIEISHWVGVYDANLESDYTSVGNTDWQDIANYTSPSETYPQQAYPGTGDIVYWKETPSSIATPSKSDLYTGVIYSPVADGNLGELRGTWDISQCVSPTECNLPSNPNEGDWWRVEGTATINGVNYSDNGDPGGETADILLYNGTTFTNAGNHANSDYRANFRVLVTADPDKPSTDFNINKVAVYATRRSVDGVILDNPFLFGQIIIPDKQLLKAKNEGDSSAFSVDELIIDFQIDTDAISQPFEDIIYASPNDYWNRATSNDGQFGLSYDGQVYITNRLGMEDTTSSFPSTGDIGVAKLLVATYDTVNKSNPSEEQELPQLVLQHNRESQYPDGGAFTQRIRTTFRTNPDGDCELDFYGSCSNEFGYYSLVPKEDTLFGLGNESRRWKAIHLQNLFELYLGSTPKDGRVNKEDDPYGYIRFTKHVLSNNSQLGMGWFGNSSVMVGPYFDETQTLSQKTNYFYTYGNISNYIVGQETTGLGPAFDLAVRSTHDIHLYNMCEDYLSPYEFNTGSGIDSQQTVWDIYDLVIAGGSARTNAESIQNVVDSEYFKKFYEADKWASIKSGLVTDTTEKGLASLRESVFGDVDVSDITDAQGEGINKEILLTAQRFLIMHGDFVPMIDGFSNLGTSDHRFRDVYAGTLHGTQFTPRTYTIKPDSSDEFDKEYDGWNWLTIDADIAPSSSSKKIVRNFDGKRFDMITCDKLGEDRDPIDYGYIRKIRETESIETEKLEAGHIDCRDINPYDARENVNYNINVGSINGIDILRYLSQQNQKGSFDLPIDPVDENADNGEDSWNYNRASSEYLKKEGGSFMYDIEGQVGFDEETKLPYIASLEVIVPAGGMVAKKNSKNWNSNAVNDILYSHTNTFMDTVKDVFGEDAVANTRFPSNNKTSSMVSAAHSDDANVRKDGRTAIRFRGEDQALVFRGSWFNPKNNNKRKWGDNNSTISNGSRMTLSIETSFINDTETESEEG